MQGYLCCLVKSIMLEGEAHTDHFNIFGAIGSPSKDEMLKNGVAEFDIRIIEKHLLDEGKDV